MPRMAFLTLALLVVAAPAQAGLAITKVQTVHGPHWPERKPEFFTEDAVVLRFVVTGAKVDGQNNVHTAAAVTLTDSQGNLVFMDKGATEKLLVAPNASCFFNWVVFPLKGQYPPGEYTLTLKVTELTAGKESSANVHITIKPNDFGIRTLGFFADKEYKLPISGSLKAGQSCYFRGPLVGLDRSKGSVRFKYTAQILDDTGRPVLVPLPTAEITESDPAKVARADSDTFIFGGFGIFSPGSYTLVLTCTDEVAGKTATMEAPLDVSLP